MCQACPGDDPNVHVTCSKVLRTTAPTAVGRRALDLSDVGMEFRVTEVTLRGVGLSGVVPVSAINKWTYMTTIDLSTPADSNIINDLQLPPGSICAMITACENGGCSLGGDSVPLCDASGRPLLSANAANAPFNYAALGYAIGGIAAFVVLVCFVALMVTRRADYLKRRKRKERKMKKRRMSRRQLGSSPATVSRLQDELRASRDSQRVQSPRLPKTASRRLSGSRKSMSRKGSQRAKNSYRADASEGQWSQAFDYQSGATYWINNVTGAFSWSPPAGVAPPGPAAGGGLARGGSMRAPPPPLPSTASQRGGAVRAPPPGAPLSPVAVGMFGGPPGGFAPPQQPVWEEIYDSATDSSYWVNPVTGQFSWQPPTGR